MAHPPHRGDRRHMDGTTPEQHLYARRERKLGAACTDQVLDLSAMSNWIGLRTDQLGPHREGQSRDPWVDGKAMYACRRMPAVSNRQS
jgi:hypothetical protein